MATLAKSAVTLEGGTTRFSADEFYADRHALVYRRVKMVLTGQGGLTNTITAHALGLSLIVAAWTAWDATNSKGYPVAVDPVNNIIVLLDGSAAPAPVDVTSTAVYMTVLGALDTVPALT